MEVGLGALRLSPETFWQLTIRELVVLHAGRIGGRASEPLGRAELESLLERFPDS